MRFLAPYTPQPRISHEMEFCAATAFFLSHVYTMLTPSIGSCLMPLIVSRAGMPVTSLRLLDGLQDSQRAYRSDRPGTLGADHAQCDDDLMHWRGELRHITLDRMRRHL